MAENGSPTDARKAAFAQRIAAGDSVEEAVADIGVSARTGYRWKEEPWFAPWQLVLLSSSRRRTLGKLDAASVRAVDTLDSLLPPEITTAPEKTKKTPPGVRVRAAQVILEQTAKLRHEIEFEERLAALEKRLGIGAEPKAEREGP